MSKQRWETNWEDFLFEEASDELSSSGNVSSWLSRKWGVLKSSTKENIGRAIQELLESAEAGHLFVRYATGQELSAEEDAFLKEQAKDIIKSLGLVGVIALPGGTVALRFLLDAANKMGIELRPSSFVQQESSPESLGDYWPGSSASATRQTSLMSFGMELEEAVGSTDTLAKTMTADIIQYLKDDFDIDDPDEDGTMEEYYFKAAKREVDVDFSVKIGKTGTGLPFYVDTEAADGEHNTSLIDISLTFDARHPLEKSFQDIYFKILEDIRHELEHIVSEKPGGNRDLSRAEYYIDKGEVPSMVRGLHLKAKKMKVPTEEVFRQELEPYLKSAEINQQEYDTILDTWNTELDKIQGKTR